MKKINFCFYSNEDRCDVKCVFKHIPTAKYKIWSCLVMVQFVSMKLWITATNVSHATVPPAKLSLPALSTSKMLSSTLIEAAEKNFREKKKESVQQKESKREKGLRDRPDVSFV